MSWPPLKKKINLFNIFDQLCATFYWKVTTAQNTIGQIIQCKLIDVK